MTKTSKFHNNRVCYVAEYSGGTTTLHGPDTLERCKKLMDRLIEAKWAEGWCIVPVNGRDPDTGFYVDGYADKETGLPYSVEIVQSTEIPDEL